MTRSSRSKHLVWTFRRPRAKVPPTLPPERPEDRAARPARRPGRRPVGGDPDQSQRADSTTERGALTCSNRAGSRHVVAVRSGRRSRVDHRPEETDRIPCPHGNGLSPPEDRASCGRDIRNKPRTFLQQVSWCPTPPDFENAQSPYCCLWECSDCTARRARRVARIARPKDTDNVELKRPDEPARQRPPGHRRRPWDEGFRPSPAERPADQA